MEWKKLYDISVTLGEESIDYPGDVPYFRKPLLEMTKGGFCNLSSLELSAHSGTHIDVPVHFVPGGKTVDQFKIDDFILPALVVDIDDPQVVSADAVQNAPVNPGEALLFRTKNSTSGVSKNGVFSEQYVHISPEAARECVAKRVALVGIDYITIEGWERRNFEVHQVLLGAGVLILESVHLAHVPAGRYIYYRHARHYGLMVA